MGPPNLPVLILGETGTGKELIAKTIRKASDRSKEPFVTVNAGGLSESILENEFSAIRKAPLQMPGQTRPLDFSA